MKIIKLPEKLNRECFYYKVIPQIYSSLLEGDSEFSFDMSESELSNAEFLVGLLSASSLISNKYKNISNLELPSSSSKLFRYLESISFFLIASTPFNKVLDFIRYQTNQTLKKSEGYTSNISCITLQSDISTHQRHAIRITDLFLKKLLNDERKADSWHYYNLFKFSLIQLIENFFEHNLYENTYECTCYYLAQKMPYDVIQIVFYDTGKGFRKRIIEIIDNEHDSRKNGNTPNPDIDTYIELEEILKNKSLIWEKSKKNSSLIALKAALDYRKDSSIPGLAVIKEFALSKGGSFFVHSANASIEFNKYGQEKFKIYDENFSGVHLCIELPLN